MKPEAHLALWITFLCRRFRKAPERVIEEVLDSKKFEGLRDPKKFQVLRVLNENKDSVPKALLGVALWNLLPAYKDGALGSETKQYEDFFKYIYGTKADEIQQTSQDTETPVFPDDPQQSMQESVLKQQENLNASMVQLEVLVNRNLSDFVPSLKSPKYWNNRGNPFWTTVKPSTKDPKDKRFVVELQLPDEKTSSPVEMTVDFSNGAFEGRTDFEIEKEPDDTKRRFQACSGYLSAQKEPGQPGLTRVTVQRTVRFAQPHLDQLRVPTALYWLCADFAWGFSPPAALRSVRRSPASRSKSTRRSSLYRRRHSPPKKKMKK
jgi:hypothetical protein